MLDRLIRKPKAGEFISKGDRARDARNWPEAARLYRLALDANDELAHIWVQYGHALKGLESFKDAESAYQRALALDKHADTYLQLGHLHKVMGLRREAEQDYLRALERQPTLSDARLELTGMGWSGARLRTHLAKEISPLAWAGAEQGAASATEVAIAFELSDLIDHLQRTRYPTGIQRVQLALGTALANMFEDDRVQFVYYDHLQSDFFEVERGQVLDIVDLVDNVQRGDQVRQQVVDRLKADIANAPPFEFPDGCCLVNVGTSWGFLNYFLTIREIKRTSGVRYVPLVHDCIPIIYPEFCNPNLVCDFINWISHMVGHADLVLANSENTLADVRRVADQLDVKLPRAVTTRLNGEYGEHGNGDALDKDRASLSVLAAHQLDVEDFVLLVSTLEPRKNHVLALNAWSRMLKARRPGSVPRLVCVGNRGWMNDGFHQRLERDRTLRERVVVMHDVPDQVLQLLYRRCLFTLFPSLYEGWGLPISEALAHGKVPLVSRVASHPEAGGDLAVYFDLASEGDFQAKLESLIDDGDMRGAREKKIAASKPLRPWSEIAKDIVGAVDAQFAPAPADGAASEKAKGPPAITSGRYYSFARNLAPSLQMLTHSGDIYRAGLGWHAPEPWGCWARGRFAEIAFHLMPEEGDDLLLYLHWTGSSNIDNNVTLSLPPSAWSKQIFVPRSQDRWDAIPIRLEAPSKREVRLRLTAEAIDDFGVVSEGRDTRLSSVGVKGLYVCRASDSLQRLAILEAITLGDCDRLARRFPQAAAL